MNSQYFTNNQINTGFIQQYLHKTDISANELNQLKNDFLMLKLQLQNKKMEYESKTAVSMNHMNFMAQSQQNLAQNQNISYRPPISQKNISSKGQMPDKMISYKKERKSEVDRQKQQQQVNTNMAPPLFNYEGEKEKDKPKQVHRAPLEIPKIVMIKNEDIWENTEIFFKGIPPVSQLKELLQDASTTPFGFPIDSAKLFSVHPSEHWTVRLNKFAKENKLKELPSINQNEDKLKKFWRNNKLSFQIEEMQKKLDSPLQRLINALVESPPIQRIHDDEEPNLPKRARKHMLAPKIPYDPYLSLDFDQKLDLELKSVGLLNPNKDQTNASGDSAFITEIETYTDQLNKIVPKIQYYKDKILSQINEISEKDKRMRESRENLFKKYVKATVPASK